jgi:hypothetical protein
MNCPYCNHPLINRFNPHYSGVYISHCSNHPFSINYDVKDIDFSKGIVHSYLIPIKVNDKSFELKYFNASGNLTIYQIISHKNQEGPTLFYSKSSKELFHQSIPNLHPNDANILLNKILSLKAFL